MDMLHDCFVVDCSALICGIDVTSLLLFGTV